MQESSTPGRHSRSTVVCALIFVACCLLSSGREVWDARRSLKTPAQNDNPANRADQRFAAIKAALPGRGVVGYVGDSGAEARGDYYAAQYALAPLVVEHSTNHALIVGNFPTSPHQEFAISWYGSNTLKLVKDFGDGVALFANDFADDKGHH